MWDQSILERLRDVVSAHDEGAAADLCQQLIAQLATAAGPPPAEFVESWLGILRRKRLFVLMRQVAEALLRTGDPTPNVRRQYAQSLIELGQMSAAESILRALVAKLDRTTDIAEWTEARGLQGRLHKQQFVAVASGPAAARAHHLNASLAAYYATYRRSPKANTWHGINAVALAMRAERDGIPLTVTMAVAPDKSAERILRTLSERPRDGLMAWDMASAAEACLALDRRDEVVHWLSRYVAPEAGADAFEIGSTLRQLEEIWQLHEGDSGGEIIAVLNAARLRRGAGALSLPGGQVSPSAQSLSTAQATFQRVFGQDGIVTFEWYSRGRSCALSVGRIEDQAGKAMGTGFLLDAALFPRLGVPAGVPLLVTNAHVVSRRYPSALRPTDAQVVFEGLKGVPPQLFDTLLWESNPDRLDAAILRLAQPPAGADPLPLAPPEEPAFNEAAPNRFYIAGYPEGHKLALSINDNLQVGWARPRLHYRTPTAPGSSGSPVFDKYWRVVGLHHSGSLTMRRADGKPGTYPANEGLWIHDVLAAANGAVEEGAIAADSQQLSAR